MSNKRKKKIMSVSVAPDTRERLEQMAAEYHTNLSQMVTNLVWNTPLPSERGNEEGMDLEGEDNYTQDGYDYDPYYDDRPYEEENTRREPDAYERDRRPMRPPVRYPQRRR